MDFLVISPPPDDPRDAFRLKSILASALQGYCFTQTETLPSADSLQSQRILFAVSLGSYGVSSGYVQLLRQLRADPTLLEGCTSALIIDGQTELFTKSAAAELAFAVNSAGSALIGRPLVEGTGSLANFRVQAGLLGTDPEGAYRAAARELAERLITAEFPRKVTPSLLALHASSRRTSNTMQIWEKVSGLLSDTFRITEIGLRNGAVSDCSGCIYSTCLHFGEMGRCFYGGVMQDEVWPAVRECDGLMMICPNYNDALSANLTAFINRLTGLFRQMRFYDKAVFAIVVSGYSGGDIVTRQLISALNMNKSFFLPPRFALLETANDPGEALRLPGIDSRISHFADHIRTVMCSGKK